MLSILKNYRHLVKPVRAHLVGGILLGLIYAMASGFGLPFLTQKALPIIFAEGPRSPLTLLEFPEWLGWAPLGRIPAEHVLTFAVLLLPLTFLIRAGSLFGKDYLMNLAGLRVLEGLRMAVFDKLQRLHLDFFRRHPAGDISQRMSGDAALVRYALVDVLGDLVTQPFTLIGAAGYVLYTALTEPGLDKFMVSLLIVPATVLPIRYISRRLHARARQMMAHGGAMNAMLIESIQAPREIRSYNLQEREIARYRERTGTLLRLQMKLVKYEKLLNPLLEFIAAASISLAIWRVASSGVNVKPAVVAGIVGALYFSYDAVKKLGAVNNRLRQAGAAIERLEDILNAPVEIADPVVPATPPAVRGEIRFDHVTFAYAGGETVFTDTSLTIAPGEIVALVGPSGSGKSTFANLVPRFYEAGAGTVRVDGVDVRDYAQADLRARIALVSQEPILFDDTIAANLRIGKPDATAAELEEAAANAGALDFIRALPLGFENSVGERGNLLSGGQRQRLAIARAFLKNAPILILDEATSALDSETEAQIQESLERLVKGKTVLIIAHRFSTIRFASRILVFDKASLGIAADGTHEALIESSPVYRNLYERQKFGDAG